MWKLVLLCILIFAPISDVFAHAKGEDYIFIKIQKTIIEGYFEVNVVDLREKLNIEIPEDGVAALPVVESTQNIVHEYIRKNFTISPAGGSPYEIKFSGTKPGESVGEYVKYPFTMDVGTLPDELTIYHNMYYQGDKTHRGLLLVNYNAKTETTFDSEETALIFSPKTQLQTLDLNDIPDLINKPEMIWQGMLHIWGGPDHVLFLLALILPTVLFRQAAGWKPVARPVPAIRSLLIIVTTFTVAHSITLLMAAYDIIQINSQLVESIIALSIVIVALNNIFQWMSKGSLLTIFFLGLFHGLGFASVMGILPFRMVDVVTMTLLFNVGVEVGQVILVLALFPLLYMARTTSGYVPYVLKGGSGLLALIGAFWFFQRALGF